MRIRANASRGLDDGSLAPLGIGLALISLSAVLGVLAAGSLYLTERRLTTVAESTALWVLAETGPLLPSDLSKPATFYLSNRQLPGLNQVQLVEASSKDSKTVMIRLCSVWQPIFQNYMFSETGRVCSEAFARRGR